MQVNLYSLKTQECGTACSACGLPIFGTAMRVRGVAGAHCTMACLETTLFGTGRCRWCGKEMEKTYTTVESRLCSAGCSDSYWKHVIADKTAALGKGKRFVRWLQINQPGVYAGLLNAGHEESTGKLGRPTKNGHTMDAAERKREQRKRTGAILGADFRDISLVDTKASQTQNVTK
jgi:hypothetical protein